MPLLLMKHKCSGVEKNSIDEGALNSIAYVTLLRLLPGFMNSG